MCIYTHALREPHRYTVTKTLMDGGLHLNIVLSTVEFFMILTVINQSSVTKGVYATFLQTTNKIQGHPSVEENECTLHL